MSSSFTDRVSAFWLLQLIGWTGYSLDRYLSAQRFFPVAFIYTAVAFLLTCLLRPVYRRLWVRTQSPLMIGMAVVACSCVAAFLWLVISQFVFWLTHLTRVYPYTDAPIYAQLADTLRYTLEHHKPFLFLSWSALYFGIKYWQNAREREEERLRAAAAQREAELKMLRYQLNPHFLFNSLNSTSALIREDPARAERMLNELSEFLRYSLMHTRIADVPLGDELAAVRAYLDIEKIRFEDKLDVRFDIAPGVAGRRVPSFLVHPLVENAIKHGMRTSRLPLKIEITARGDAEELALEVVNTGRLADTAGNDAFAPADNTGIGLENVRERLRQAFGGRGRFRLFERDGRVHARIEVEKAAA